MPKAGNHKAETANLFVKYESILQKWAADVPADMLDEDDKEKLLDAFLRLFEKFDAAGLKKRFPQLRAQKAVCELISPLAAAIRWQMIGLGVALPPLAAHALAFAAARWGAIWLGDNSAGAQKLMAAIDRDLGRVQDLVEWLKNSRIVQMRKV